MAYCNPLRFSLSVAWVFLVSISASVVAAHEHPYGSPWEYSDLSAESILDRSIRALGGQGVLESVKTISSHAL